MHMSIISSCKDYVLSMLSYQENGRGDRADRLATIAQGTAGDAFSHAHRRARPYPAAGGRPCFLFLLQCTAVQLQPFVRSIRIHHWILQRLIVFRFYLLVLLVSHVQRSDNYRDCMIITWHLAPGMYAPLPTHPTPHSGPTRSSATRLSPWSSMKESRH